VVQLDSDCLAVYCSRPWMGTRRANIRSSTPRMFAWMSASPFFLSAERYGFSSSNCSAIAFAIASVLLTIESRTRFVEVLPIFALDNTYTAPSCPNFSSCASVILQCFWYPARYVVWAIFRASRNAPVPNVTRLAERLLATDDVAEAQSIAKELRAAIQDRVEGVRRKAHLISHLIPPPNEDDSAAKIKQAQIATCYLEEFARLEDEFLATVSQFKLAMSDHEREPLTRKMEGILRESRRVVRQNRHVSGGLA